MMEEVGQLVSTLSKDYRDSLSLQVHGSCYNDERSEFEKVGKYTLVKRTGRGIVKKICLKVSLNLPDMKTECRFLLLFVYSMIGKKNYWGQIGVKMVGK